MNRKEITEFKKFLEARKLYGMFALNYRQYRMTNNPSNMEDYLERAKAALPQDLPGDIYEAYVMAADFIGGRDF